jgi:hypothetical protein
VGEEEKNTISKVKINHEWALKKNYKSFVSWIQSTDDLNVATASSDEFFAAEALGMEIRLYPGQDKEKKKLPTQQFCETILQQKTVLNV